MKIKSKLLLVFALCLAVLFAVSLVACNDGGNDGSGDGPNDYETSTYTVTFNTDSKDMTSISTPVIRDVPYGAHISEPTDANGNKIIPYKRGYIFQFWKKSNGDEFDFKNDTITANTTLTAAYKAIEYYHTAVLTEKYVYDRTEIDSETDTETDIYVKVSRAEGEVTISDVELDKGTTTLKSTYAVTNSSLPCPTSSIQGNKFCFWYYINKDGKPIQFSKWATDGATTVGELASYSFVSEDINDVSKGLELYPMFTNDLPTVTVKYLDSADGETLFDSEIYTFGQNVEYATSVGPAPEKDGYTFVEWYYEVEQTSNGVTTTVNSVFVFDDGLDDTKPTSPMDAAGAEDNFKPVELVLKAKWIRQITIANLNDYKELYSEIKQLTKLENPTDEEQARLDEILNANIVINAVGGIDFGNESFEPLFDKAHPFKGTIDGLTKTGNTTPSVNTLLTGGLFGDSVSASVFGYNEGTIKNLDFKNIGLQISDTTSVAVQFGVITTDNAGTIESCTVTIDEVFEINDLRSVVFGGITAFNHGIATRNGIIRNCTVTILSFNANCKALTFGGIAGESNASTSITSCTVNAEIETINCVDDGIPSNGKSSLTIGGVVGFNSSAIRLCKVELNVKNAISLTEFVFGGVAGVNNGSVRTTYATATLGDKEAPVSARGSVSFATCLGGLVGKNGGYILNCYATANIYVQVENQPANTSNLYVGGLVGSNYSDLKDSQDTITDSGICAINYSYSLGEIVVNVKNDIESVNVYAGGIAGRNSHKKVASLFSTVKISVTNDGNSYLGHIFGKMVNDVGTNGKIFYDNDSVISLVKNGVTYEITGDGKDSEEFINFEDIGEGTDAANFKKAEWVVGSDTAASPIGFGGTTWEVKEGEYPSFLDSIYEDNTTTTAPDNSDSSDDSSSDDNSSND